MQIPIFVRFAFAETDCKEEIDKAVRAMDNKVILGRYLRVRSAASRSSGPSASAASASTSSGQSHSRAPAGPARRDLRVADVKRHLAFAFNAFLEREAEEAEKEGGAEDKKEEEEEGEKVKEGGEAEAAEVGGASEETKKDEEEGPAGEEGGAEDEKEQQRLLRVSRIEKLRKAQELIKEAFELPEDDKDESLKVSGTFLTILTRAGKLMDIRYIYMPFQLTG